MTGEFANDDAFVQSKKIYSAVGSPNDAASISTTLFGGQQIIYNNVGSANDAINFATTLHAFNRKLKSLYYPSSLSGNNIPEVELAANGSSIILGLTGSGWLIGANLEVANGGNDASLKVNIDGAGDKILIRGVAGSTYTYGTAWSSISPQLRFDSSLVVFLFNNVAAARKCGGYATATLD